MNVALRRNVWFGRRSPAIDVVQFVVLAGGLLWLAVHGAGTMGYNWQWYRVPVYVWRAIDGEWIWGPLMRGLVVTLEISAWSFVLAMSIGLATALLRTAPSIAGRALSRCYLELIRNTPLLVQIYLFYYILAPIFGIDRFLIGVLALGFFEGAFAAEIFRAGIQSVPRGQWEAGESLGLGRFDLYRDIVLPQAIRLMLPPLTGLCVSLIKHSAIVSVIAVFDLTTEGRNVISDTFLSFEIWFTVAAIYLVLTVSLSSFASWLEYRFRTR